MNTTRGPRRRKFHPLMALGFLALICLFLCLAGGIVMLLWNHVLAEVLEIKRVSFWQAIGILVLCRILFGGFRGKPWSGRHKTKSMQWKAKWMNMDEQQRSDFKNKWQDYCDKRDK